MQRNRAGKGREKGKVVAKVYVKNASVLGGVGNSWGGKKWSRIRIYFERRPDRIDLTERMQSWGAGGRSWVGFRRAMASLLPGESGHLHPWETHKDGSSEGPYFFFFSFLPFFSFFFPLSFSFSVVPPVNAKARFLPIGVLEYQFWKKSDV